MAEVMIPPWVRPESPESIRWIDDATQAFPPAFGRGTMQRGIWADPRWGLRRRYRGLRSDEKAAILNAINDRRGQLNILRVTPHAPIRGSFATSELLTNNTFASGTTGWTSGSEYTLSVSDRVMRATRNNGNATSYALRSSAAPAIVQWAPYVMRAMVLQGRGAYASGFRLNDLSGSIIGSAQTSYGLLSQVFVGTQNNLTFGLFDNSATGQLAGDHIYIPYVSIARCAQVDNAPNALLQSETLATTWTQTGLSALNSNAATDPYGTSTADNLVENSSSSAHSITQTGTKAASAEDWCVWGWFKRGSGTRDVELSIGVDASNLSYVIFDLGAGTAGTVTNSGTNTNGRAYVASLGNGWYYCALVAKLTTTATTRAGILMVSAGNDTYTGDGSSSLSAVHVGAAQTSWPSRGGITTSTALASGTAQTGSALYTRGWPVSTSGLLLPNDWIAIGGELKQLTAPVNSDAAGMAYIRFRPGLASSPADGAPIVVHEPFGRFVYPQGIQELENQFGLYADCEMELEETYSS